MLSMHETLGATSRRRYGRSSEL